MHCSQCGRQVNGKALFCPYCGRKLDRDAAPASPVVTPPVVNNPLPAVDPRARPGCTKTLLVLVSALIVLLLVLGIGVAGAYVGANDRARIERQAAEEHYQSGLTYLQQGQLELAIAELELVLQINPQHPGAEAKLTEARQALRNVPTPTSILQADPKASYLDQLRQAYDRRDWAGVQGLTEQLMNMDPTYHRDEIDEMLFNSYYTNGLELVEQDRLQEAIRAFDQALLLKPDHPEATQALNQAMLYMNALSYWNADWGRVVEHLVALHQQAPGYKDVGQRLYTAYVEYGNTLGEQGAWCDAEKQYAAALSMAEDATLAGKRQDAAAYCAAAPAQTPQGKPDATATIKAPKGTYVGQVVDKIKIDARRVYIRGRVLDKNKKPVAGTRIEIRAWDWTAIAVSDGAGQYSFDGLNNAVTYTLTLLDVPSLPAEAPGEWGQVTMVDFQPAK